MEIGVGIGVTQFDQFEGELQDGHTYAWTFDADANGWTTPAEWSWTDAGRSGGGMLAAVTPINTTQMYIYVLDIDPAITAFTFSAYVRCTIAQANAFSELALVPYDKDGFPIGDEMVSTGFVYTTPGAWQKIELSGIIPEGTVETDIYLRVIVPDYDHEYVEVWFDDVSLTVS
jgi:hypothetical protein